MRTTTLYKSIKLVAPAFAVASLLALALPALAMDKDVEGVGLKESIELPLDFSESDYLLVTASQSHADYSLTLTDKADASYSRRVDIDAKNILEEVFLVNANDCKQCVISLDAKAEVDRSSPYKLSTMPIGSDDAQTIKALTHITEAGEILYAAGTGDAQYQKASLAKAATELGAAAKSELDRWRRHAMVSLSSVFLSLEDSDRYRTTLNNLLTDTAGEVTPYRIPALFGLAEIDSDREKTFALLDEGLMLAEQLENDFFYARVSDAKGIILVLEAKYDAAIELIENARTIYSKTSRWRFLMGPLHNLSWAYMRSGDLPRSLAAASEQRLTAERYAFEEHALWALYNFALAYGQSGDRAVADKFLDDALARIEQLPIADKTTSVTQLKAFILLERTQRSLQYGALELADDYAISAKREFEKLGQPGRVADINFLQGGIRLGQKNFDLAQGKFIETIEFDKKNRRNRSAGAHLLMLADLKIRQGEYVEASKPQAEALKILSTAKDYRTTAIAFRQAVFLLHKLGANEEAESLASRTSAFINKHGLGKDKARFEYNQALVKHALGKKNESLKHLELTRSFIEKTLPKVRRRDLRRTYLALQKSVFELNVKLLIEQNNASAKPALLLAEAFKARTLEESIRDIDSNQAVDTEQLNKRSEILREIQQNAMRWHQGQQNIDSNNEVLSETRALSRDLEKLEVDIKLARDSESGVIGHVDDAVFLQANPGELIAYYFMGEEASWLWVIVDRDVHAYPLPGRDRIETLVNTAMQHMVVMPTLRKGGNAWEQVVAIEKLGEQILAPLSKHLAANQISLITIVPDGVLHALPFAPLPLPGQERPLISDYAVSYAPSLSARDALGHRALKRDRGSVHDAIIVADPRSYGEDGLSVSQLDYSRQEAQYVSSLISGDVVLLMAKDANKQSFLEHIKQPFGIMHFATHGLLNSQEPSMSGLLFSSGGESGSSLWLAPEISRSNIDADLVVLSACDSSVGKHLMGEGLFSLSRAFIEGGANQVLGTLWKVEDGATAELMKLFYTHLTNDNISVAEALRRAQEAIYLDKNNDWQDPYYWAGFQLQGGGVDQTYASSK